MTHIQDYPKVNPDIVFSEDSDGWGILFDPKANETYGLSPISAFIWKHLNGENSIKDILHALENECDDEVPEEAFEQLDRFLKELEENHLLYDEKIDK